VGATVGNSTLADLVTERVGALKAHRVLTFIAIYGVFVEQNGREPRSVSEMSRTATSERSRATIDRYGAAFREAFPEYDMPTLVWAQARQTMDYLNVQDDEVLSLQLGATPL
jgi:hypothetical protein